MYLPSDLKINTGTGKNNESPISRGQQIRLFTKNKRRYCGNIFAIKNELIFHYKGLGIHLHSVSHNEMRNLSGYVLFI